MSRHFDLCQRIDTACETIGHRAKPAFPNSWPQPSRLNVNGAVSTEVGKLVQRLFLSELRVRSLAFTGIEDGAAARVCAFAGDLLAAYTTGTVCLVDANLHTPELHQIFGVPNGIGLSDLVLDSVAAQDAKVQLTDRLALITSGSRSADQPYLLDLEIMRVGIAELRAHFDYLLIHTPPAGLYPDPLGVAPLVDGAILVIQANSTRRDVALQAKEQLVAAGGRILGAVLTDRTFPIPDAIYSRL
jgi:Mrp family chromosome partitioning ATPase